MRPRPLMAFVAMVLAPMLPVRAQSPSAPTKPRVVITADPELDDTNALIRDPDGNRVTTRWWQDTEAGTYLLDVTIADATATVTTFHVPADAGPGQTIHLILEAADDGTPTLTRYQRVIVTVR
jgi:hypothetical protein